jgi:hypothetical protein
MAWSDMDARREYMRTYMKAWRRRDPSNGTRQSASARKWQKSNPVRHALYTYRARAARHGLEFSLLEALFRDLITDNCFYCGATPSPINGVDRVDNGQGYTENNSVSSCGMCNKAKNNKSLAEFEAWATRLSVHRQSWAGIGAS